MDLLIVPGVNLVVFHGLFLYVCVLPHLHFLDLGDLPGMIRHDRQ